MDGDQGHHRAAGCRILADIGAQVGDQAGRAGADLCVGQVQCSLFQVAGGTLQGGVDVLAAALGFPGALHFGLGRGDLADGLLQGGARDFQATQGNGTRVFAVQAFETLDVLARLDFVGLGGAQGSLLGFDTGGIGTDRAAGGLKVGAGAVDGDLVLLRVHFEQHFAGLDVLVIVHMHFDHPAGHFRGHRYHERLHPCLLRIGRVAVGHQVPDQAQEDYHNHPIDRFFHRVGRGGSGVGVDRLG
ncbi:hypothetical protein D3C84_717570 [compost metagenome]